MMRIALYTRVSTLDQHPETQLLDLQQLAQQRGWNVVREYRDHGISGVRVRRPGLEQMLADARRGQFDLLAVWSCDRMARSTRHFLEILDELSHLNIKFVSFREALDTAGALGRAVVIIISAIAELERNLIIERVRAGMRRARLEGIRIGRRPAEVDRASVLRDREHGHSLTVIARDHHVSRALISKILKEANASRHKGSPQSLAKSIENRRSESAA
jgi:DNA invertase Pin-like site-specific DNA recombinase